jgi:hypothetical protein
MVSDNYPGASTSLCLILFSTAWPQANRGEGYTQGCSGNATNPEPQGLIQVTDPCQGMLCVLNHKCELPTLEIDNRRSGRSSSIDAFAWLQSNGEYPWRLRKGVGRYQSGKTHRSGLIVSGCVNKPPCRLSSACSHGLYCTRTRSRTRKSPYLSHCMLSLKMKS